MEILVSVTLAAIFLGGAVALITVFLASDKKNREIQTAIDLGGEISEQIKRLAGQNWQNIYGLSKETANNYYTTTTPIIAIFPGTDTLEIKGIVYTRWFYVENVYRDASGEIVGAALGIEDPSTQFVVTRITWPQNPGGLTFSEFLTRSRNEIFRQTDWSGGGSQENFLAGGANHKFAIANDVISNATTGLLSVPILDLTDGLVGYWSLDEGSGVTAADTSGNGNNGTLGSISPNTPTWTSPGIIGSYAISFDGDADRVSIGDPISGVLDFGTGSFSYGLWVNVPSSAGSFDMPFFKGGSSASVAGYDFELGTGSWMAVLSDGSIAISSTFGTESDFLGRWVHLMAVVDRRFGYPAELRVYADGVLTDTKSLTGLGSLSSSNSATIGSNSSGGFPFKGKVDEVRIYNKALIDSEVRDIATRTFYGRLTSSVFDTGSESGIQLNSILWQGSPATGSTVKFQIASSSCQNGRNNPPACDAQTWVSQDIGTVGITGIASESGGTFTINGSGDSIFGTADAFRYLYWQASGDLEITAHVASMTASNPSAKTGVMVRDSLTAPSRHAMIAIKPNSDPEFLWRASDGGSTSCTLGSGSAPCSASSPPLTATAPYWVKIRKDGSLITAYTSPDGSSWMQFGDTQFISFSNQFFVGLAVTSADNTALNNSTFDNVTIIPDPSWKFVGPSGTDTDWYSAPNNTPMAINRNHFASTRYFRYRMQMDVPAASESPRVDDVIINYSP